MDQGRPIRHQQPHRFVEKALAVTEVQLSAEIAYKQPGMGACVIETQTARACWLSR